MQNPLAELPGIGPERLRRLQAAGFDSVEALANATPEEVPGIPPAVVRRVIEAAQRLLAATRAAEEARRTVLPFQRPTEEPSAPENRMEPAVRLARGLAVAREIERSSDLVRRARAHCKKAGPSVARERVRRELKRLRSALEGIQQSVIANGLSDSGHGALRDALDPLDATLERLLAKDPGKQRMREARKVAKAARKAITA